jgi:hypothetical protein
MPQILLCVTLQDLSSRSVSHNIVASFQENELLEMLRPSLSPAAKQTLVKEGPQVFAARWAHKFCIIIIQHSTMLPVSS